MKAVSLSVIVQFPQCITLYQKLDILCSQKNKKWALTHCQVTQTNLEEIQIKMEAQVHLWILMGLLIPIGKNGKNYL